MRQRRAIRSLERATVRAAAFAACALVVATAAAAQDTSSLDASETPSPVHERRPQPRRLYFGMWTTHLKNDVVALQNNWVAGVTYHGFFGGTFLNSYGRRAFTGGLQRTYVLAVPRPIGVSAGFRLGFITGYDGRLIAAARHTPVLPLAQPFVSLDVTRVGFEVSYTIVVVSVAASYRF